MATSVICLLARHMQMVVTKSFHQSANHARRMFWLKRYPILLSSCSATAPMVRRHHLRRFRTSREQMADKVRIGVIGLGIMGEQYVRIYNAHPLAVVTAICTRGQERLDEIGDKYGIKTRVTDYHELLAQSDVDAVCVATPDFAHYEPVKAALAANKHVLCEK